MHNLHRNLLTTSLLILLLISCLSSCALIARAEDATAEEDFSEMPFITVTVSIEKFSINGEYVVEPTLIRVPEGTNAATATLMLLDQLYPDIGQAPYRHTGVPERGDFYLQSIWDPTYDGTTFYPDFHARQRYVGYLSESDCGDYSPGWCITVDNLFIGHSAAGSILQEGSVVRWQYTVAFGLDIGMYFFGSYNAHTNKDALTRRVAEIRYADQEALYGEAYEHAMDILKTLGFDGEDPYYGTTVDSWEYKPELPDWYFPPMVAISQATVDATLAALVMPLEPIVELVSVVPEAFVTKLNGNANDLTITITEELSDGTINTLVETFSIKNNAADTYTVGNYNVYVDTKGNTQIRDCYIISTQ